MDTKWKNLINQLNIPSLRKNITIILLISVAVFIFSTSSIFKFSLSSNSLNDKNIYDSDEFYWETREIENLLVELIELKNGSAIATDHYALESYSKSIAMDYIEKAGYWYDSYYDSFYNDYTGKEETGIIYVNTDHFGTVGVILGSAPNYSISTTQTEAIEDYAVAEKSDDSILSSEHTSTKESVTVSPNYEYDTNYYEFKEEVNLYSLDAFYKLFMDEAADYYNEANLNRYNNVMNDLANFDGLVYYVMNGIYITSNTSYSTNEFENLPFYYMADSSSVRTNAEPIKNRRSLYTLDSDALILYGFENSSFNARYSNWQFTKAITFLFFYSMYLSIIATLLSLAYILYFTGNPVPDAALNANGPRPGSYSPGKSRIYTDLGAGLILLIIAIASSMIMYDTGNGRYWRRYWQTFYSFDIKQDIKYYFTVSYLFWGALISLVAAAIITYLIYCIVWDVKSKQLLTHSLLYRIYRAIGNLFLNISNKVPIGYRLISVRKMNKVKSGIRRIQEGDYSQPIKIKGHGPMAQIAEGINDISIGFNIAVENRTKSERMKTELISNVSHDIRTPLTSIITYVDLLKKEENITEDTAKYLEVLESKTARLKILIDDLFEASKISSGNITTELMPTDLSNVLEQAMGELEDKIEASGLVFKIRHPNEKVIAMADGKILWRIINNLFSNIFKYSMPNSRVYIDIFEDNNGNAVITFKNMSAYELNISSEELMERFTRGDKSRNSEGSGLGLNIARSLTELMGGQFDISLDGDLFKVIITLKRA